MNYAIKPLSCDPSRVRGMSERLIVSHYENNYCGAVKRLNLIQEQLAGLDPASAPGYLLNGLKREELVATNSMVLHELFFDGLGEASEPGPGVREALARDFGSYERWRSEFVAMGKALGGGPVLALDMYEHSYHMDFGAKAAGYVDAFMDAVQWKNVERRLAEVARN